MKWIFEISEDSNNMKLPIVGTQVYSSGVKNGPFHFALGDFIEALLNSDNLSESQASLEATPILPPGTIMHKKNKDSTIQRFYIEYPKAQYDIQYNIHSSANSKYGQFFTVGFPRLLVSYLVVKSFKNNIEVLNITEMNIYAVKDDGKAINHDTELFNFPYPNVYKNNHKVCMGSVERLSFNKTEDIANAFGAFINSQFNEDLGMSTTLGVSSFLRFLEGYQNTEFNDEWLMPSGTTAYILFK